MYRGNNPLIEQLHDIFVDRYPDYYDRIALKEIAVAINDLIEEDKRDKESNNW